MPVCLEPGKECSNFAGCGHLYPLFAIAQTHPYHRNPGREFEELRESNLEDRPCEERYIQKEVPRYPNPLAKLSHQIDMTEFQLQMASLETDVYS